MGKLFFRSLLVLALLFGMVLAVGTAVLYHYDCPVIYAVIFATVLVTLQYIAGPYLIDWIYKVRWTTPQEISPEFTQFLTELCRSRNVPMPRFGIIEDGNPNAFTYGHVPKDARVVVTRGLIQMLTPEELNAVVAHEVGHIKHYDFIIMSLAALATLILYYMYVWTRGRRGNAALIGLGAYVAYLISQYVVLFLSRIREYFADEHAVFATNNANAMSRALIKIAYGLARIPQEELDASGNKKRVMSKSQMVGSLGICSFSSAASMAINSTDVTGCFSVDKYVKAMQWDLWNPWAVFFELHSTHPLIAKRVRAASRMALSMRQQPELPAVPAPTESYMPLFWKDLLYISLPWLGVIAGVVITSMSGSAQTSYYAARMSGHYTNFFIWILGAYKLALLLGGIGWLVRLAFSYNSDFKTSTVEEAVGQMQVSHIRPIPIELEGQVIGRGIPGLFWSKDLVIQDQTGFITLVYKQPLGILEFLFGLLKADALVGKRGKFQGWYRRGPSPYIELKEAQFEDGTKTKCAYRTYLWILAGIVTAIGAYLVIAG